MPEQLPVQVICRLFYQRCYIVHQIDLLWERTLIMATHWNTCTFAPANRKLLVFVTHQTVILQVSFSSFVIHFIKKYSCYQFIHIALFCFFLLFSLSFIHVVVVLQRCFNRIKLCEHKISLTQNTRRTVYLFWIDKQNKYAEKKFTLSFVKYYVFFLLLLVF